MADTLALDHPLALPPETQGPDSTAVILSAAPPLVMLDLRCRERPALNAFLKKPLGLASPPVAHCVSGAGGVLFRLGPDWWQLRCNDRKTAGRLLKAGAAGPVGVTDISDSYLAIGVAGPRAREVLAKAATPDLHPDAFPAGSAARTLFGRVTVIVSRLEGAEPPAFDVTISRSNARFLWRWLADAAREYGYTSLPFSGGA
ncbi:MAG: hypothetical protein OXC10_08685 [Rhodospirillaceae bacterium]|nr:hypothetical protein [Rhodospirillaceae bacterium]